ncbi:diadenylate cyclase CdaA [Cuneatibacter caecimuris]|uniref:Diadenylate cyclase n=1 Tax=Cuneatibacter caecimuris TaxID=1796618 RepID=A0A4Q7NYY8_9FIRM|nr:diadenylate cyclase CdaA [Cuneatibacter caecimuris]RZS92663.1 diadenylate cyclase [Cuneatibacter caecimuris]
MEFYQNFIRFFQSKWFWPRISVTDVIEIVILAFAVYYVLLWIQKTKAWVLLKGVLVLAVFFFLAAIFHLDTIQFLLSKILNLGIITLVVLFQPEIRRALEQLGRKNLISGFFTADDGKNLNERFSDQTVEAIVRACYEMGRVKTGALIVIEQETPLGEYENTGIPLDALVTVQLLIQIFEHNTPLHDGAIIIRGNRIVAATCYLPLSDNMDISKELGTRHRAALGISEVTDSLTIAVSEETGHVSLAVGGELFRNVDSDSLRAKLRFIQRKSIDVKRFKIWRGRQKDERKAAQ